MQPPSELAFVVLWSRDLASQRRFFSDVMGYAVQHESADAVVLGGAAAPLVLQRVTAETEHLDGSTQFGYAVDNVDAWLAHLSAQGARILSSHVDVGEGRRAIVLQAPGGQSLALVGR